MLTTRLGNLGREARIEAVRLPLQRRPGEQLAGELEPDRALLSRHLRRSLRRIVDLRRERHDLRLARALERVEADERLADRLAHGHTAVVPQQHQVLRPEIGDYPL